MQYVEVTTGSDGSALLHIDGRPQQIIGTDLADARERVMTIVRERAAHAGEQIALTSSDPDGVWTVVVEPNGQVSDAGGITGQLRGETPRASTTGARLISEVPRPPQPGSRPAPALITPPPAAPQSPVQPAAPQPGERRSFLTAERAEAPASTGWRGGLRRLGIRVDPSAAERAERADIAQVSQHWGAPKTIVVVNPKGGGNKTPSVISLAAVFARYGGAGVLAWDNNQTRGTLGWRTLQGPHSSTVFDLLGGVDHLLSTSAQLADVYGYVHHQPDDKFDVLRSRPDLLSAEQRYGAAEFNRLHQVASKYFRLTFIDSGNDESDPMWLAAIDHADQIVVATTTRDDHAEAGALMLEALARRNQRSAALAARAVVIVSQADRSASTQDARRVADGYRQLAAAAVVVPFDPAMVSGVLHYEALRPDTQRAWLAAAANVARGL